MAARLDTMLAAFKENREKFFLKGNALDETVQIASRTVTALEQELSNYATELGKTKGEINELKKLNGDLAASKTACQTELKKSQTEFKARENKMIELLKKGNAERKNAAARANRYKARFDHVLDAVELVIPGSKELLLARAIPEEEKMKKLKRLDSLISKQKAEVKDRVAFDHYKKRDVFLEGYAKEKLLLIDLRRRKKQLEAQKSY